MLSNKTQDAQNEEIKELREELDALRANMCTLVYKITEQQTEIDNLKEWADEER